MQPLKLHHFLLEQVQIWKKYAVSNITNGQHNVIYSAVGFKTVNVLVDFNGDVQRDLSFAEDALLLDEAVVIGYGTARTKDLTGSAVIVKSEDLIRVQ